MLDVEWMKFREGGKSALAACGVPVRPPGDGDGAPKLRCGVRLMSTYKFKR